MTIFVVAKASKRNCPRKGWIHFPRWYTRKWKNVYNTIDTT